MRKQLAAIVLGGITVIVCGAVAFAANDSTQIDDDSVAAPGVQRAARDDDGDRPIEDGDYDRAAKAALDAVGGGKVLDVDRESERGATWEVEILKDNGNEIDVLLDRDFRVLHVGGERDGGEGADDDGDGGNDD